MQPIFEGDVLFLPSKKTIWYQEPPKLLRTEECVQSDAFNAFCSAFLYFYSSNISNHIINFASANKVKNNRMAMFNELIKAQSNQT